MKLERTITLFSLAAALAFVAGCAKPTVKPEAALVPDEKPAAAAVEKAEPDLASYMVQPGDSLWKISAEIPALGDAFRWPLLYKGNRDQITDPDLIQPRQELQYRKKYDETEVSQAVEKARSRAAYVPHSTPVKDDSLKY